MSDTLIYKEIIEEGYTQVYLNNVILGNLLLAGRSYIFVPVNFYGGGLESWVLKEILNKLETLNLSLNKNSKKYFTAYLPVAGDVNIGDMYICDQSKLAKVWNGSTFLGFEPRNKKKVCLFLVSSDINLGDTYYRSTIGAFNTVTADTIDEVKHQAQRGQGIFTVIGKISPSVDWLNEYDELDETDVQFVSGRRSAILEYVTIKVKNHLGEFI